MARPKQARGPQSVRGMAAVFCLVMLPAIAAVGFMLKSAGTMSFGAFLAVACFTLLAAGVFGGLAKMARGWEEEAGPEH